MAGKCSTCFGQRWLTGIRFHPAIRELCRCNFCISISLSRCRSVSFFLSRCLSVSPSFFLFLSLLSLPLFHMSFPCQPVASVTALHAAFSMRRAARAGGSTRGAGGFRDPGMPRGRGASRLSRLGRAARASRVARMEAAVVAVGAGAGGDDVARSAAVPPRYQRMFCVNITA